MVGPAAVFSRDCDAKPAASSSASSSSATVGEMDGVVFFLLELSELERRRMKRDARLLALLLLGFGLVVAESEPLDPVLPSASDSLPLVSVVMDGDSPLPVARAGLLWSRDDRRLPVLNRRGKERLWCVEGGRDGDREGAVEIVGDARRFAEEAETVRFVRLSVDGDLLPMMESRRSLIKSLTTVRDERRLGRADSSTSSLSSWAFSPSRSSDCDLRLPFERRRWNNDAKVSGCVSGGAGLRLC
jgi:hypothetical protein